MGITGLWKIVEPTCTEIPLECLEGKKLAVDVSIWIYQAQLAYPADQPYPHLRLLINRLCKLLFYKIRPVFVFDGPNVPALKKQVLDSRRAKKLQDDDILTNPKKLNHLKQIASGQLTDEQLAKTVQHVISPTKRVVLNDVYKDMPSTSNYVPPNEENFDQIYVQSSSGSDEEGPVNEKDEKCFYEKIVEDLKIPENATRRQKIDTLVERRETMRKSRLHPSMIPEDSQDFSRFQMQRLLRRGRLNAEIDAIAKNSSSNNTFHSNDKINVLGPDGTQHVLKYSHSDEIQVIKPENKRDIECLYNRGEDKMDLSLALFNVEYGGAQLLREKTPFEEENEEKLVISGEPVYQSKSGMLEAIARKRVRNHYKKDESSSSGDEFVDVSDSEVKVVLKESEKAVEEVWDPEKIDRDQQEKSKDISLDDEWLKINYEDDDKTPEMYRDLQEFLTNCGIPWLEAPGEAEAQCVELERLGLVDGVISDDSDVWAFGVKNVYRHMFAKNKRVQRYSTTGSNKTFCLEREDFIAIGILAGGDYSGGLNKVGAIGALELVAEFVENRKDKLGDLGEVERRILRLLAKVHQLFTLPPTQTPSKTRQALTLRRHVIEANEAHRITTICENGEAVNAYLHPNVDSSSEKFRWRKMNIELIRNIMQQRFHWGGDELNRNQNHEEKNSIEAFERWNGFLAAGGVSQMRLDRFFAQPYEKTALTWSKKVTEALAKISKKSTGTPEDKDDDDIIVEKQITPKKKKPVKRTRKPAKGRNAKKPANKPTELNLSEESSDDSF